MFPEYCWIVNQVMYQTCQTFVVMVAAATAAKSLQSCPTLCDPSDGSPPGSPVPGILQARTLEWVAISFSHAWKWKNKMKSLSRVRLLATPWTAAHQAPPSMGFARQEYWSGVPLPPPWTVNWPLNCPQSFLCVAGVKLCLLGSQLSCYSKETPEWPKHDEIHFS